MSERVEAPLPMLGGTYQDNGDGTISRIEAPVAAQPAPVPTPAQLAPVETIETEE